MTFMLCYEGQGRIKREQNKEKKPQPNTRQTSYNLLTRTVQLRMEEFIGLTSQQRATTLKLSAKIFFFL